jgi:hypothetical protein
MLAVASTPNTPSAVDGHDPRRPDSYAFARVALEQKLAAAALSNDVVGTTAGIVQYVLRQRYPQKTKLGYLRTIVTWARSYSEQTETSAVLGAVGRTIAAHDVCLHEDLAVALADWHGLRDKKRRAMYTSIGLSRPQIARLGDRMSGSR